MAAIEFPPITVTLGDGKTLRAEIWPSDIYRLEEHADTTLTAIGANLSFRQLLPLAWFSLYRSKQIDIPLDDFVGRVKAIDIDATAADPKDTGQTPSTG